MYREFRDFWTSQNFLLAKVCTLKVRKTHYTTLSNTSVRDA